MDGSVRLAGPDERLGSRLDDVLRRMRKMVRADARKNNVHVFQRDGEFKCNISLNSEKLKLVMKFRCS